MIRIQEEINHVVAYARVDNYTACIARFASLPPFLSAYVMMEVVKSIDMTELEVEMKSCLVHWRNAK